MTGCSKFCLRLVRLLFGADAIAEKKLEHGNPLTVLGISIEINDAGVVFQPDQEKVRRQIKHQ